MPSGSWPTGIVTTALLLGSIRDTVFDVALATQMLLPPVIAPGPAPTGMVRTTAFWAGSIRDTVAYRSCPECGRADHPGRSWAGSDHRRQQHLGGQCHVEHRVADRSEQQCCRDDPRGP